MIRVTFVGDMINAETLEPMTVLVLENDQGTQISLPILEVGAKQLVLEFLAASATQGAQLENEEDSADFAVIDSDEDDDYDGFGDDPTSNL